MFDNQTSVINTDRTESIDLAATQTFDLGAPTAPPGGGVAAKDIRNQLCLCVARYNRQRRATQSRTDLIEATAELRPLFGLTVG